jgi:hypothetical protein
MPPATGPAPGELAGHRDPADTRKRRRAAGRRWRDQSLRLHVAPLLKESPVGINAILGSLGIPAAWQYFVTSLLVIIALAGLDFIGSVFAKEWAEERQPGWFLAGMVVFGILFVVYANSLRVAELSVVAFGWVIFLQVGILLYERIRYGVELPPGKWAAIAVILALQAYLILSPNTNTNTNANAGTGQV